ncbi:MAG: 30S ribosomal protein S13 [Candidatus Micrarchaeota archaeon]
MAKEDRSKTEKPKEAPKHREVRVSEKAKAKEAADFRGVIRFIGCDLDGHLPVGGALRKIKGVGHNICGFILRLVKKELNINADELVGNLTEEQVDAIEEIVTNLNKRKAPSFLLNRQRDMDSGSDKHLISSDLTFQIRQDIEREKNSRSWKGWRHQLGQPVRGQRNRTTGRKGLTVGVLKKALKQQKTAAAGAAQKDKADKK